MADHQRIEDCHRLYQKYGGKQHERIEREMRALGHKNFSRRILYARRERGRVRAGWIERFAFRAETPALAGAARVQNKSAKRPGVANVTLAARIARPFGKFNHGKWRRERKRAMSRGASPYDEPTISTRCGSPRVSKGDILGVECIALPHGRASATPGMITRSSDGGADDNSPNSPNSMNSMTFPDWLTYVSPYMKWDAAHHRHIIDTLARFTAGEIKRLMIFMPPRHGKSELVTVRYAAWRMRQKPETNVIIGSYNQRLANRFSRKIKTVLCDDMALEAARKDGAATPTGAASISACHAAAGGGARAHENADDGPADRGKQRCLPLQSGDASPFPFARPRLKNSESEWETTVGGGLRAVGVGSGITGFGANLIIVDDPVKSRAEAESIKYRERVWDWFNDDLYTRLEPDGQIILIQTRWHEDDLAGRLLAENESDWTVIDLPALAEASREEIKQDGQDEKDKENESASEDANRYPVHPLHPVKLPDVIGRQPGDALWPERFNTEHLENTKEKIGAYSFASLYQQHPVPAEGGMFKKEWFTNIVDSPPRGLIWKRGYDLAITANPTSDYTASFRVAYDKEGNLWIDGGYRARIEYPEQRRYVLGRIREETDTEHGIEQSANGTPVYQEIRKEVRLQGRAFRAIQVKGDKATRAAAWLNLAAEGKLRLVRAGWNKEFIDECCAFPLGTHDDQVDAVSIAVAMHTRNKNGFHAF